MFAKLRLLALLYTAAAFGAISVQVLAVVIPSKVDPPISGIIIPSRAARAETLPTSTPSNKKESYTFLTTIPVVPTNIIDLEGPANPTVPKNGTTNAAPYPLSVNAVSGFAQSCSDWGGIFGTVGSTYTATLVATCRTTSGGSKTTSLDLNRCIVNDNGNYHMF